MDLCHSGSKATTCIKQPVLFCSSMLFSTNARCKDLTFVGTLLHQVRNIRNARFWEVMKLLQSEDPIKTIEAHAQKKTAHTEAFSRPRPKDHLS